MHTIYHQIGVRASAKEVYDSLTSAAGIAGWWSSDVDGSPQQEDSLFGLGFGTARMEMRVVQLDKPNKVVWQCTQGDPQWENTKIEFHLSYDTAHKQTILDFLHKDWADDSSLLRHCSTKWAVYMLSLKDLLEKGEGNPYPQDVAVNHT